VDVHALARYGQTAQSVISIFARDGATRTELEVVAQTAMLGWDAHVAGGQVVVGQRLLDDHHQ
jgi:hypothetical protein